MHMYARNKVNQSNYWIALQNENEKEQNKFRIQFIFHLHSTPTINRTYECVLCIVHSISFVCAYVWVHAYAHLYAKTSSSSSTITCNKCYSVLPTKCTYLIHRRSRQCIYVSFCFASFLFSVNFASLLPLSGSVFVSFLQLLHLQLHSILQTLLAG